MKINLDDPKLTAYALDELSGAERIELEKAIAESPEAKTYVDNLRGFSLRLKSEYDAELETQEIHPTNIIPIAEPDRPWSPARRLALAAAIAVFALIGAVTIARVKFGGTSDFWGGAHLAGAAKQSQTQVIEAEPEQTIVTGSNIPTAEEVGPPPPPSGTVQSEFREEQPTAGSFIPEAGRSRQDFDTATYDHIEENPFLAAAKNPLSTFSIDVDTASDPNTPRFINQVRCRQRMRCAWKRCSIISPTIIRSRRATILSRSISRAPHVRGNRRIGWCGSD